MSLLELVVGLVILVGLVGIVVPVLPGSVLVLGAVLVWSTVVGTATGWAVFAVAATVLVVGAVVKYVVPGRGLRTSGVPTRSLVLGGLLGIVGFFVVPVVGLFIGFVAGIYLAEVQRVGRELAGPTTRAALKAVGISVLIELVAALTAAGTWLVGVLVT